MPNELHPDKLVGAARALQRRPGIGANRPAPRPTPGLSQARPAPGGASVAPARPAPSGGGFAEALQNAQNMRGQVGPARTPNAKRQRVEQAPGLLEQMAFAMRDRHWNNHLQRLFQRPQPPGLGAAKPAGQAADAAIKPARAIPKPDGLEMRPPKKPPIPFINLQIGHPIGRG